MKQGWAERQDEQMKEKYYGYCPVTVHRKSHLYTWGNVVGLLRAFTSKNNRMFPLSWKRVLAWFLHGNVQRPETDERVLLLVSRGHSLGKQTRFCNPRADKTLGCEIKWHRCVVLITLQTSGGEFRSKPQYSHFTYCRHYKWLMSE